MLFNYRSYCTNFIPTAEFAIPAVVLTKVAKAKMETHPVTVEA